MKVAYSRPSQSLVPTLQTGTSLFLTDLLLQQLRLPLGWVENETVCSSKANKRAVMSSVVCLPHGVSDFFFLGLGALVHRILITHIINHAIKNRKFHMY